MEEVDGVKRRLVYVGLGCGDSTERGPVLDLDSRRLIPWCLEEHIKREQIGIKAKGSSLL